MDAQWTTMMLTKWSWNAQTKSQCTINVERELKLITFCHIRFEMRVILWIFCAHVCVFVCIVLHGLSKEKYEKTIKQNCYFTNPIDDITQIFRGKSCFSAYNNISNDKYTHCAVRSSHVPISHFKPVLNYVKQLTFVSIFFFFCF